MTSPLRRKRRTTAPSITAATPFSISGTLLPGLWVLIACWPAVAAADDGPPPAASIRIQVGTDAAATAPAAVTLGWVADGADHAAPADRTAGTGDAQMQADWTKQGWTQKDGTQPDRRQQERPEEGRAVQANWLAVPASQPPAAAEKQPPAAAENSDVGEAPSGPLLQMANGPWSHGGDFAADQARPMDGQARPAAWLPVPPPEAEKSPAQPAPADASPAAPKYILKAGPESVLKAVPELERQLTEPRSEYVENCPSPKQLKSIRSITDSIRPSSPDVPPECTLGEVSFQSRTWRPVCYTWTAPGTYSRPLYFEDVQLERYGHSTGYWTEPFLSAGKFFATVPLLPYFMGVYPPYEHQYSLGYYRPGGWAPSTLDPFPISVRGALYEGLFWAGIPYFF